MSRDPIDQVHQIVLDVTTIDAIVARALHQMGQSVGGYASSVVGAAPLGAMPPTECHDPGCTNTLPCETHDPAVDLTTTERLAGRRDKAQVERELLTRTLRRIARDTSTVADICKFWGLGGVDNSTVKRKLNDALANLWCENCIEQRSKDPGKRTNGNYCEFCSGIKSKYKRYPNQQLMALHVTGRYVMPADVFAAFKAEKELAVAHVPNIGDARRRRDKRIGEAS